MITLSKELWPFNTNINFSPTTLLSQIEEAVHNPVVLLYPVLNHLKHKF